MALKLLEIIKKYQKKKRTERLLLSGLENEIRTYTGIYEKAISLSEEKIMPILQSVEHELTPHDMNELLEAMLPLPTIHAEWIKAFISLAKACTEMSVLKGLMDYLKETDVSLYDFVYVMKNSYVRKENKVIIDGSYYRFFKTYEKEIFGKGNDLNTIERELKPYVEKLVRFVKKIRHYVKKTAFIKRQTIKKYRKNYREYVKASAGLSIQKI